MVEFTVSYVLGVWDFLKPVAVPLLAVLLAFMLRRGYQKFFKEYDRSMLIWLGTNSESRDYANVPLKVGRLPFTNLTGEVESDLDIREVIGFVVGKPRWLCCHYQLPKRVRPTNFLPGYYAYCVIQWEYADKVRRYDAQQFHIRRTRYAPPEPNPDMRETIFLSFGTDATPDEKARIPPHSIHIQTGILAAFRYQPYLRGGFRAEDIKMRALAPQTKTLIHCKNVFTKEWRNG